MSLFQCENCGCKENTALASTYSWMFPESYDWTGKEERRGKKLCSACLPEKYSDGTETGHGKWHGKFDRHFLPKGEFVTDDEGNLRHKETGLLSGHYENNNQRSED